MRMFFAGSERSPGYDKVLVKAKATYRLESFYMMRGRKVNLPLPSFRYLLDSGGFSARMHGIVISVKEYAEFVNKHDFNLIFNLDTRDVKETAGNQIYLEKHCPQATVIPIYHLSDYMDNRRLLQEFIADGYKYIGVGGVAGEGSPVSMQKELYNYVFKHTKDKVKVHGLGITAKPMLELYPWYSVDSTSWLSFARYASSRLYDAKYAKYLAKTKHYLKNTELEVAYWVNLEKEITRLWTRRGVIWN